MIKILLIDCSRSLEEELRDVYDVHHPPVGLVALATHIEKSDLGKHTNFKIIDSTIDYETYEELVNAPGFNYKSQESLMTSLTVEMVYDALITLCRKVKISS